MQRLLILFVLVLARVSLAQDPVAPPPAEAPPPLVQAPAEPQPSAASPDTLSALEPMRGEWVRVHPRLAPHVSGELVSLTPGALSLQVEPDKAVELALAEVERVEVRKRSAVQGALLGAAAGGAGMALYSSGPCKVVVADTHESPDNCIIVSGLLGAVAGVVVGAVIGMAVTRWEPVYTKGEQTPSVHLREPEEDLLARWLSGDLPEAELGLRLGYAREVGSAQSTGGPGGRLHALVRIGPHLALGPEVAWYQGVGTRESVFNGRVRRSENNLFQAGGLLRLGGEVGPVRAALLGGLGHYSSGSDFLGASVGGEVEARLWQRLPPLAAEVRYHLNTDVEERGRPGSSTLTLSLGTRLRW